MKTIANILTGIIIFWTSVIDQQSVLTAEGVNPQSPINSHWRIPADGIALGPQIWLNRGLPVKPGVLFVLCNCPRGWRLPDRSELEQLIAYAEKRGGDSFLESKLRLRPHERLLMTFTKTDPKETDAAQTKGWTFFGYDRKKKKMDEVHTYAVGDNWYDYKKSDLNARCLYDSHPVSYQFDPSEGMVKKFSSSVQGASSLQWSFGDGESSQERNPVHEYKSPGLYDVALKMEFEGDTYEYTRPVRVRSSFGSSADIRSLRFDSIESSDTGLTVAFPSHSPYNYHALPVTPIHPLPSGGGIMLWTSPEEDLSITEFDKDLKLVRTIPAGKGFPGAVTSDGTTIAYLAKLGKHRVDFRISGEEKNPFVIMDNDGDDKSPAGVRHSGRGHIFWDTDKKLVNGTQAMFEPFSFKRVELLQIDDGWFAAFPHANNFTASNDKPGEYRGSKSNSHSSELIMTFERKKFGEIEPRVISGWGVSHCMDLRSLFDGDNILHLSVGDVFPSDLHLQVWNRFMDRTLNLDLFGLHKFPDTYIGLNKEGVKVYGVAGGPGGVSMRLGEMLRVDHNTYVVTYSIRPGRYGNNYTAKTGYFETSINELGILIFNREGDILLRKKLRQGADVEFLHTVPYGKNILIAWKTEKKNDYRMMLAGPGGDVIQSEQKLPENIFFNASDAFRVLQNGDVVWTAATYGSIRKKGELKFFRIRVLQGI